MILIDNYVLIHIFEGDVVTRRRKIYICGIRYGFVESTTYSRSDLTPQQWSKMGLLYNWAAACGLSERDAENALGSDYERVQGICPNGWHVPTRDEWRELGNYLDGNDGTTEAGIKVKSETGWYYGHDYVAGTNESGFSALPAGYANGADVRYAGIAATIWTSTASEEDSHNAYYRGLGYNYAEFYENGIFGKNSGRSVRCIRDR